MGCAQIKAAGKMLVKLIPSLARCPPTLAIKNLFQERTIYKIELVEHLCEKNVLLNCHQMESFHE